jgi:tetratricopeptide (TPR) repeat protein
MWSRPPRRVILSVVALVAFCSTVRTESMLYDIYNVPLDRLVANLEASIAKEPRNAELRVNLARVHIMAFALKTTSIPVLRGMENKGPASKWLRENEQPEVTPTSDPAARKAAADHLAKAIQGYQESVALAPDNAVARLGLAWAYQQSKDTAKAIAAYRAAIEIAWPQERDRTAIMGWLSVTEEASRYLVPLLDPARDKEEIGRLRGCSEQLEKMARAITPIVIPLGGLVAVDRLVDRSAVVAFDADGSGLRRSWTWITPDAGWLVFDSRQTRQIQSGLQLFGSVTFWLFWDNGYQAMRSLDDDGDGRLRGTELAGLAIWRDANGNGVSEPGEVTSLAAWNIVELSCDSVDPGPDDDPTLVTAFSPQGFASPMERRGRPTTSCFRDGDETGTSCELAIV